MKPFIITFALGFTVFGGDSSAPDIHKTSTTGYETSYDGGIAQFVDGGSWLTVVTLANLDSKVCTYTIKFYGEDRKPLVFATTDGTATTLTGMIPAAGSHVLSTLGTNSTQSTGWALVSTSTTTGGNAIFRQRIQGRPDFEASMPIMLYIDGSKYAVPFDNLSSSTGLALVNPLSYTSITAYLSFYDETGSRFYLDSITLGPLQHTSFDLGTKFAPSFGKRGVLQIETSEWISVLALRFFGAAFTSLLPLNMELAQ